MRSDGASAASELKKRYDFIVCGAGSSGSAVARRLAENPDIDVLLIEAGGSDDHPHVMEPLLWPSNLLTEREWGFFAEPEPQLNGRSIPMTMGKVLGGGSSINVAVWAWGHRTDWDFFAREAGDLAWGYEAVVDLYRGIENWRGTPDPDRRGEHGPVYVQPAPDPSPIAFAMLDAAKSHGIPVFDSQNGRMMEGEGGCALTDVLIRDGKRHSVFRAYVHPYRDRSNLTVLTDTLVTRVLLDGKTATGVELVRAGETLEIGANAEVILSLGAINTPKVLMHSGVGDAAELAALSIPVVQHLPGVGKNLQDHLWFGCIWEYKAPLAARNSGNEATLYWKTRPELDGPDLLFCQAEFPVPSPETAGLGMPEHGWTMAAGLARPESRGQIRVTSADPAEPAALHLNPLSHPADLVAAKACVALAREIGNSAAFHPYVKGEAMPGPLKGADLEQFIRNAGTTYRHQSCTAKMGRDPMAAVDSRLKVYGIEKLRIADASIFPRVTTGNTMAPCVVVGERAAQILRSEYRL